MNQMLRKYYFFNNWTIYNLYFSCKQICHLETHTSYLENEEKLYRQMKGKAKYMYTSSFLMETPLSSEMLAYFSQFCR